MPYDDGRWVTDGGWWVTPGGWCVSNGGWWVTDGGWWVTDGGWCVTEGGWWVTDGGWWVATKHQRVDAIVKKKRVSVLMAPPRRKGVVCFFLLEARDNDRSSPGRQHLWGSTKRSHTCLVAPVVFGYHGPEIGWGPVHHRTCTAHEFRCVQWEGS